MPFTEPCLISAQELRSELSLEAVHADIQNNLEAPLAKCAAAAGSRPLPAGGSSPFMVVGLSPTPQDKALFFEDADRSAAVQRLCGVLGLDRKDLYLTYALKYPFDPSDPSSPCPRDGKWHARSFLAREIFCTSPEIIVVMGDWAATAIKRAFYAEVEPGLRQVTLGFSINGRDLEYKVWLLPVAEDGTVPSVEEAKALIAKLKVNWKFVHLHTHDSLSLKDGVGVPETRIQWHVEHKKPAIAITNHGNISSWIKTFEGARSHGMTPILGMEAYVNRQAAKLQAALVDDSKEHKQMRKEAKRLNRHITLLAKNGAGFFSLIKIHNDAWLNRYYRYPICDPEYIKEHHDGVICLSGCSGGEQNRIIVDKHHLQSDERKREIGVLVENKTKSMTTLMNTKNDERASEDEYLEDNDLAYFYAHSSEKKLDKEGYGAHVRDFIKKSDGEVSASADKKVREIVDWWHGVFGEDYYLELMVIDHEPQKWVNEELIKVSREKGIPVVLTNDCHYIITADSRIQELQMLSEQEKTFQDLAADKEGKIWTIKSRELYFKSVEELHEAWEKWHKSEVFTEEVFWQAVNNTVAIVDKVQLYDLDKSVKLPKLYGSEGASILVKKVSAGMKKYGIDKRPEYVERIRFELDVIVKKAFVDYFLVLEDLISWIKTNYGELAIGAGRGSAASSLVNYCLGLTYVDPIRHKLLFERFLDPSREDLPDIDLDVQPRIRDAVVNYLVEKYGKESVALIGTFGMLKLRSAILDAARVCGIPVSDSMSVTTKLGTSLDDEKKTLEQIEKEHPDLRLFLDKYDTKEMPLRYFIKGIRGAHRQPGTHAAGILISSNKLTENIPLIRSKKSVVTGWIDGEDGRELSGLNYSKMDILGLKNLQVIEDALKLIKARTGKDVDIASIDIEDKHVFENTIKAGDNFGVFQLEGSLGLGLIKKIQPDTFEELSDINAIMRPGPLDMGTADRYSARKHGELEEGAKVAWKPSDIPACIREILGPTYGELVYQEQLMLIAERIGGHTKMETNRLRKLIIKYGKTGKDTPAYAKSIKKHHDKFIENAAKPENLGNKVAAMDLWELMANFAEYAFNMSHAVSYTLTSYREYWLKTYYPAEFNVALLNNTDVSKEKKGESVMSEYITEIVRNGFTVSPPLVNQSGRGFAIGKQGEILWGLGAIKGLTDVTINAVMDERGRRGAFDSLEALYERVGARIFNKRVLEALVWSGALDEFIDKKAMTTRFDLHRRIFQGIRGEKKYVEIADRSQKALIEREIDMCKLSLTESTLFNKYRRTLEKLLSVQVNPLYEVEQTGQYKGIGKVEKIEKKVTKSKKDYRRISLRDETHVLRNVYVWPWHCQNSDSLRTGMLIYGDLANRDGFIDLNSFKKIGDDAT